MTERVSQPNRLDLLRETKENDIICILSEDKKILLVISGEARDRLGIAHKVGKLIEFANGKSEITRVVVQGSRDYQGHLVSNVLIEGGRFVALKIVSETATAYQLVAFAPIQVDSFKKQPF